MDSALRKYVRWLPQICCLTGQTEGLDAAHTGGWKEGKGQGQKAAPQTVLPLLRALHAQEERGRTKFWHSVGIDPIPWAARLYDCYEKDDREGAELLLADMADEVDADGREFIIGVLR